MTMHANRRYCGCWVMTDERRRIVQIIFCDQHSLLPGEIQVVVSSPGPSVDVAPVDRNPSGVYVTVAAPPQPVELDNAPPDSLLGSHDTEPE